MRIAKKKKKKEPIMTSHPHTKPEDLAAHCVKGLAMGCSHVLIEMCGNLVSDVQTEKGKEVEFVCQGNRKMNGIVVEQTPQGGW